MVKKCANPKCAKPLHYLREGRVFVFEAAVSGGDKTVHHLEHFWLCGECSQTMRLERTPHGVRAIPKRRLPARETHEAAHQQLAS